MRPLRLPATWAGARHLPGLLAALTTARNTPPVSLSGAGGTAPVPDRPSPQGPRARALAWAELLRVSALFTVPGDALAGAAAAGLRPNRGTALAVGASLCLYEAGMALNDWADREEDAIDRPHRPIPSGRIAPGAALTSACALTAAGLTLAARASRPALAVATALAATVWAYDLHLKHTRLAPAAMATARSLDVLLGATSTASRATTRGSSGPGPSVPAPMAPGSMAPGRTAPRSTATGPTAPRSTATWRTAPGSMATGRTALGHMAPGRMAPRPTAPGPTAPGPTAPRSTATRHRTLGLTAPGPVAPRSTATRPTAPRSTATWRTAPGSMATGRTALGLTAPGPMAPRSTAPGPTATWQTAPTGRVTPPPPGAGSVGSGAGVGREVACAALVLGAHTYGVTAVSRHEAQGGSTAAPLGALAATVALCAAVAGEWRGPGGPPPVSGRGGPGEHLAPRLLLTTLTGAYFRTAATPLLHAALNPSPPLTQRAVGGGIRAMIPLQAALATRAGAPLTGLAVTVLVPLARKLARKVSPT